MDREVADTTESPNIAGAFESAGAFAAWHDSFLAALDGGGGVDVPCGSCTACCSSSQFVHIEPHDIAARRNIPTELLFPAPGLPDGHHLLGYDQDGRCPMLGDSGCTIYEHRPAACRVYDCRVYAATSVELTDPSKREVAERVTRWRFDIVTEADASRRAAVLDQVAALGVRAGVDPTALALEALRRAVRE